MAARQGLPEDLMDFGLRVPPRVGVALAAVSWMVFHVVAGQRVPVAGKTAADGIAAFTFHTVIYFSALFLQFAVPFCLLVGVTVSLIKRHKAKRLLIQARENPAAAIAAMSWRDFERLVGGAFRAQGYEVVEFGGPAPDGGVDLRLTKDRKRYLVQCKHWKAWQVGVAIVRELNGVVAAEKADGGFVITGGTFSADARAFADTCGIKLVDGPGLQKMIGGVGAETGKPVLTDVHAVPQCPECGASMVERVAGQGQYKGQKFWGCSTYPKCFAKVHIERVA